MVPVKDVVQDLGSRTEARLLETRQDLRQRNQPSSGSPTQHAQETGYFETTGQSHFPCSPIVQDHQFRTESLGQQDRLPLSCLEPP